MKGLDATAFAGEVTAFTGAHGPDEAPACPQIAVDTEAGTPKSRATLVIAHRRARAGTTTPHDGCTPPPDGAGEIAATPSGSDARQRRLARLSVSTGAAVIPARALEECGLISSPVAT